MIKEELISKVAKKMKITKADIRAVVDCVIDTINDALLKRETVEIVGFCKFRIKVARPHYFMNMKTKERYMGEPKYTIDFKINEKVRQGLNSQKVLWQDIEDYLDEDLKKKVFAKKEKIRKREELENVEDRNKPEKKR